MWIKTLFKKRAGPNFFANLIIEDGSGFRNFTRMRASEFELLATIFGFKFPRQDTDYRNSVTVIERLAVNLIILATCDLIEFIIF
jgi:hypothetical protein